MRWISAGLMCMAILLMANSAYGGIGDIPGPVYLNPVFHVSLSGNDENDGRSWGNAFRTISHALVVAAEESTADLWAYVYIGSGIFDEPYVLFIDNYIHVIGQGPDQTEIRSSETLCMYLSSATSLSGVTLSTTVTDQTSILAHIQQTQIEGSPSLGMVGPVIVSNCRFRGQIGAEYGYRVPHYWIIGVSVMGGSMNNTIIVNSRFENFDYGITALSSGVNVTRCYFENVWIAVSATLDVFDGEKQKQSGVKVPMLGTANKIDETGLNTFRDIDEKFVENQTDIPIEAEMNDWGVYTQDEINERMDGEVKTTTYLSQGIGPGTVVAALVDTQDRPIPDSANPQCIIPATGQIAQRDPTSGSFVFTGVSQGVWVFEASAVGYNTTYQNVEVQAASVTGAKLQLTGGTPGNGGTDMTCGQSGKFTYAVCMLILLDAGRRVRRRKKTDRST